MQAGSFFTVQTYEHTAQRYRGSRQRHPPGANAQWHDWKGYAVMNTLFSQLPIIDNCSNHTND